MNLTELQQERELIVSTWIAKHSHKLVDMSDLILVQHARKVYLRHDNEFKLSPNRLAVTLGCKPAYVKRRLNRLTRQGVFKRYRPEQGTEMQYQGYRYSLGWSD